MLGQEERVANLQAANARKTAVARGSVLKALDELAKNSGTANINININAVAVAGGVSRGFIYSQPDLRELIATASARSKSKVRSAGRATSDASLLARLETALDAIRDLKSENRALKERIENLAAQLYESTIVR